MTRSSMDRKVKKQPATAEPIVEFNGEFIHIKHRPGFEITSKSMETLWTMVGERCIEHECTKVLVQAVSPTRSLDTMDAFDSGIQASKASRKLKVALCFENYQTDETSDFFKTVARNRGAWIEFFPDFDSASAWLLNTPA